MSATQHVLIVGGGIAGLATAWFLTRKEGVRVTLLEKESTLGTHSTGRNAAILRTWTPDPILTRLALESASFLHSPPSEFSSESLVEPCGIVLGTNRSAEEFRAVYREGSFEPPAICELSEQRFRELAPHFRSEGRTDTRWMHFPGEGRIDVEELTAAFARGIEEAGGRIRLQAEVSALALDQDGVHGVRLADGSLLRANRVVLAAGGWAARLGELGGSRVRLRPTRRHILVTEPDDTVDPEWPIVWSDPDGFYARPHAGGLMLCSCDQTDVDPDSCALDMGVLGDIAAKTRAHLEVPREIRTEHFWAGIRTLSHDGRFTIGDDPTVPGLFWVAALGGHGMTSCAAIGRIASALLCGEPVEPELEAALSPSRTAQVREAAEPCRATSRS